MAQSLRKCHAHGVLPLAVLALCVGGADPGVVAVADPVDVDVRAVTVVDRAVVGGAAAVGGGAGGFIGGAMALAASAALSGVDRNAALLPLVVLPPIGAASAAYVTGRAVGGPDVGFAASAGAGIACTLWSVGLGVLLASDAQGLLGDQATTFGAAAVVPAVVGVVGAGVAAAVVAPALE